MNVLYRKLDDLDEAETEALAVDLEKRYMKLQDGRPSSLIPYPTASLKDLPEYRESGNFSGKFLQPEQAKLLELHQLLDTFVEEMRRLRTKMTVNRGMTTTELAQRRNWELGAENHRLRSQVYNLKREINRLKMKYEGVGQEELEDPDPHILRVNPVGGRGRGRCSVDNVLRERK